MALALTIALLACLGAFGTALADDGPWYEFATGSCDAPNFTTEVTAGQTILLVSGGLMSGSPFNYIISPYGETSRPAWWNTEQTVYTDLNGTVCVEAFATAADDYGMFIVTIHSLDANQRQYNPATRGVTVLQAPTETPTPAPTGTPAPTVTPMSEPTDTPEPAPTEATTPVPTDTATPLPTETPVLTDTPAPTETPTPEPTDTATPVPTATATPLPTNTPVPTDTPAPTETATPVPTNTPAPTAVTSEVIEASQPQLSNEAIESVTERPVSSSTPMQPLNPVVAQPGMNTSVSATQGTVQAAKSITQPKLVYRSFNRLNRMDLLDAQAAPYARPGSTHGAATKFSAKIEPQNVIGLIPLGKLITLLIWFIL